jgi:tetratricopeptide (TPR) repeat protein
MHKRSPGWMLVAVLWVGVVVLCGACGPVVAEETSPAPAADKPPAAVPEKVPAPAADKSPEPQPPAPLKEPPPQVSAQEAVAIERAEKQVASVRDKLAALQTEEMAISNKVQNILLAGSENVKDMGHASENLSKGRVEGGLAEYRQALATSIQMWQAFGEKVNHLLSVARTMERNRERSPKSVQPKIQEIFSQVEAKYRSIILKIADLYERGSDYRNAVILYQMALELLPEKTRYRDKELVQKMVELLEKLKEFKVELQLLKAYAAANPTDTSYAQKISEMEKKYESATVGPTGTPTGTKGSGKYSHR